MNNRAVKCRTKQWYRVQLTGFFVISRFDDVRSVLLDPERFSSQTYDRSGSERARAQRMLEIYQYRGWVPAPTLVDAFIDKGYCGWMQALAVPLPLTGIGQQVGVPEANIWKIKAWTDAWVQRASMMQSEEQEHWSVEMEIEAQHYFQPVFERLRTRPDDTLLSDMVNRVIPEWDRPLNDDELHAAMMADTFVGGSETSTNAIAYGMKLLIENPHIWSQLKADPDQYMNTFVEEVVRLEGPVQGLMRVTTCDGDEFACPADIDLERAKPGRHLGFGSGIHHCLGAPLARRELFWAFTVLVERIEDMWFALGKNDFTQAPSFALRALRELHIEFKAT